MESYKNLIREFGKQLRVKEAEADDQGYIALTLNTQTLHLQYNDETNEIVIFTELVEIEPDRLNAICPILLSANIFWQGAAGATFSMEPTTRMVFLAERQAFSLIDLRYLNNWLERFLNISNYWSRRLVIANAGGSLDSEAPALYTSRHSR